MIANHVAASIPPVTTPSAPVSTVFTGTLAGPIPPGGKQVVLEARAVGGQWIEFHNPTAKSHGQFSATHRFTYPGPARYEFRAICKKEADFPFSERLQHRLSPRALSRSSSSRLVAVRWSGLVTRRAISAAVLAGCAVSLPSPASAVQARAYARCGTFQAYGHEYGVYITDGHVKCRTGTAILKATVENKGRYINNGYSYNSYSLYEGWLCPSGQMGEQTCEHTQHPEQHPRQQVVSVGCKPLTLEGCPRRLRW